MVEQKSRTEILKTLLLLVVTGVSIGMVMAVVSNGFVRGVRWLTEGYQSAGWLDFTAYGFQLSVMPLVVIFTAATLILVVRHYFGLQRFHGPADSIYAAHRADNELDLKSGFGSTLSAFISAAGGASVGLYGPLVHFGATMGSYLKHITRSGLTTDIFLGCGVAGAISAGFNAPAAGILFAHEAILRHFSLRAVTPIAISSLVAASFSKYVFGDVQVFEITQIPADLISVQPLALALGPVFGLIGVALMVTIRRTAQWGAASGLGPRKLIYLAAGICGTVGIFIPEILGLGSDGVRDMLAGQIAPGYLGLLLVAKILMSALCIGLGMFGGVFSPALFVGAAAGALSGAVLSQFVGGDIILPLTVAGMAAVIAPVIGAPISVALIILEMTGSYEMTLLALGAVVTSALTSSMIFGHSFFDRQLLDRGIDIKRGRGHLGLMETPIGTILTDEYIHFGQQATVAEVMAGMVKADLTEAYIIAPDGCFFGKVILTGLIDKPATAMIADYADRNPLSIKHDASLQQSIEAASAFVGEAIPVIDRDKNMLLGVVSEADIFMAYLKLQSTVIDLETR